jgi:hypothetical protein
MFLGNFIFNRIFRVWIFTVPSLLRVQEYSILQVSAFTLCFSVITSRVRRCVSCCSCLPVPVSSSTAPHQQFVSSQETGFSFAVGRTIFVHLYRLRCVSHTPVCSWKTPLSHLQNVSDFYNELKNRTPTWVLHLRQPRMKWIFMWSGTEQ